MIIKMYAREVTFGTSPDSRKLLKNRKSHKSLGCFVSKVKPQKMKVGCFSIQFCGSLLIYIFSLQYNNLFTTCGSLSYSYTFVCKNHLKGVEMNEDSALPDRIYPFKYQIAGHHPSTKPECIGVLVYEDEEKVLKPLQPKPRGEVEKGFYENIWNEDHAGERRQLILELRKFVPKFYGIETLPIKEKLHSFLVLDNLLKFYRQPCVMDVKIGRQTWEPAATLQRVQYELKKYPIIHKIGFRFLGMSVYRELNNERITKDKEWGKTLYPEHFNDVFSTFFHTDNIHATTVKRVEGILMEMKAIEKWFQRQRLFAFYSSSILLAYEGEASSTSITAKKPSVHMIDFTHVYDDTDKHDENYIFGLKNFIFYLENYLSDVKSDQLMIHD
ncbi:Inositol polyphosphate multikinase [Trichinella britovi]|uniref:Kinase n=2 Tax=Trichinella TaxID=6333 RepID=A0A0V1DI37_TRIBR|nr:Inositol polyphosphate multikinase [Trichinella sp. T6]KRY61207.1 Inositol polyphosphate multikinase [Trichinella britovi]